MPVALLLPASGLLALALALPGVLAWARRREAGRLAREIVGGLSHDLRTPLTQILLLDEMLLLGRERSAEEREEWLRIIGREARTLADRVDNLVLFAHSRRSRLVVVPRPTDVAALVEDVAARARPAAEARGMSLALGPLPAVEVPIDAGTVRHALLNLVDNALRFGPDGQVVRLSLEGDDGRVTLVVADQGPGVPRGERRRIWRPFARLRPGAAPADGGAGLGLPVVHAIARAHGGSVDVEDAPGGGARFRLSLPAL